MTSLQVKKYLGTSTGYSWEKENENGNEYFTISTNVVLLLRTPRRVSGTTPGEYPKKWIIQWPGTDAMYPGRVLCLASREQRSPVEVLLQVKRLRLWWLLCYHKPNVKLKDGGDPWFSDRSRVCMFFANTLAISTATSSSAEKNCITVSTYLPFSQSTSGNKVCAED